MPFAELGADLTRSIGRIRQHLQAWFLTGEQLNNGGPVASVRRRQRALRNDPGFGFDRDVCLVAIAIFTDALVHMTGLGIDDRDHTVGCDTLRDPPRAGLVAWFDVLASNQREQTN